jgi:hypothetical protein
MNIGLGFSENRMLKEVFGSKREEVTGEWRGQQNGQLYDLCSAPNIVLVIKPRNARWAGACSTCGEQERCNRVLAWKPEGKRPLGRTRHRWKDNIKWIFKKCVGGDVDWIGLSENRNRWRTLVIAVMNHRFP